MKAQRVFEAFATTINNINPRLMKTGDRCFHIGIAGGCGLRCAAFCDGECGVPYEFSYDDLVDEFDEKELEEIIAWYPKFSTTERDGKEG